MTGTCHGVKCAFRRSGTCNYLYLTGKPRGCPPGKDCTFRTLELPPGLLAAEEDQGNILAIPSEATLRKRAKRRRKSKGEKKNAC